MAQEAKHTAGQKLYDKTGAVFHLDHEHEGVAYVRPLVRVFVESYDCDGPRQEGGYEPAEYLVTTDRAALFDAPPVAMLDDDIATKTAELAKLIADAAREADRLKSERSAAERQLYTAKNQLETWMKTHRVMMDLGKLLDGQVLYPLSVGENHYHHARDIPRIPQMRNAALLAITSGDFEKGQKWVCKPYGSDRYGSSFRFFDTEEERASVIRAEFASTCEAFRKKPNFDTTAYTASTTLHYGTLLEWVATHPSLSIPKDIKSMKADNDAETAAKHKAKLEAELAALSKAGA